MQQLTIHMLKITFMSVHAEHLFIFAVFRCIQKKNGNEAEGQRKIVAMSMVYNL